MSTVNSPRPWRGAPRAGHPHTTGRVLNRDRREPEGSHLGRHTLLAMLPSWFDSFLTSVVFNQLCHLNFVVCDSENIPGLGETGGRSQSASPWQMNLPGRSWHIDMKPGLCLEASFRQMNADGRIVIFRMKCLQPLLSPRMASFVVSGCARDMLCHA